MTNNEILLAEYKELEDHINTFRQKWHSGVVATEGHLHLDPDVFTSVCRENKVKPTLRDVDCSSMLFDACINGISVTACINSREIAMEDIKPAPEGGE